MIDNICQVVLKCVNRNIFYHTSVRYLTMRFEGTWEMPMKEQNTIPIKFFYNKLYVCWVHSTFLNCCVDLPFSSPKYPDKSAGIVSEKDSNQFFFLHFSWSRSHHITSHSLTYSLPLFLSWDFHLMPKRILVCFSILLLGLAWLLFILFIQIFICCVVVFAKQNGP